MPDQPDQVNPLDPRDVMAQVGLGWRDSVMLALRSRGLTLAAVGREWGIVDTSLSAVLSGGSPWPNRPARTVLADALDVPIEWVDEYADQAIRSRWGRTPPGSTAEG